MQILGVHGISQEQKGRRQLVDEWLPGLVDGVEQAGGREAQTSTFDLCFYGDLFLPPGAHGRRTPTKGAQTGTLASPLDEDEMEFLSEAITEVESSMEDLGAPMGAPRVPELLQPLARRLARRLNGHMALEFIAVLRQVKAYLRDEDLALRIRQRLLDALDAEPAVVLGHSLGSVVAVETLMLNPGRQVPLLVTMGSPLSMRAVQSRLRRPTVMDPRGEGRLGVARWVNVFDPADPVAAAGGLGAAWPIVEDYTVENGKDPHAIRPYLGKRVTGQAVLDGVDEAR